MKNLRLGLCCVFKEYPIHFRIKQAKYLMKFSRREQLDILSDTVENNCTSLMNAVRVCHELKIGSFRINSRFLPLKTHPAVSYELSDLPAHEKIMATLKEAKAYCREQDIRLTFHPDQFILLTSPKDEVVQNSISDLMYHDELAEIVGADVITIHGGGSYGDKMAALSRLEDAVTKLSPSLRGRLAFENDDRVFSPQDLLPICSKMELPFIYDVHHHRCLPDELSEEEATALALKTWNREPLFHLSTPKDGWESNNPRPHADMINPTDFPKFWLDLPITVEIEAKAKELAIQRLQKDLGIFDGGSTI